MFFLSIVQNRLAGNEFEGDSGSNNDHHGSSNEHSVSNNCETLSSNCETGSSNRLIGSSRKAVVYKNERKVSSNCEGGSSNRHVVSMDCDSNSRERVVASIKGVVGRIGGQKFYRGWTQIHAHGCKGEINCDW